MLYPKENLLEAASEENIWYVRQSYNPVSHFKTSQKVWHS